MSKSAVRFELVSLVVCGIKMKSFATEYSINVCLLNNKTIEFHGFKVCKSVHHHTIQINQPTTCYNFSSLLLDVYVQLKIFQASSRLSSGAQQVQ